MIHHSMFNLQHSAFNVTKIPEEAQIIFVSDLFVDDYVGGAELTTEALIEASPLNVHKVHSRNVTMALLEQGSKKFWIFGNFAELNAQLIPAIVANLRYTILEYDYKFCRFRSPEKHEQTTGKVCDCDQQINGKLVSAFFYGSMGLWWMSEAQKEKYIQRFPFLGTSNNIVLSSVFSHKTLGYTKTLREKYSNVSKSGWVVLGSDSWVKGKDQAIQWCVQNDKQYEIVWNVSYDALLEKLAKAEGFVYLPVGSDTCPRMTIEAKLLGCQLELNENVQHSAEDWFNTNDVSSIEEYLYTSPGLFWKGVQKMIDYKPSIGGYVTTFNCMKQSYPIRQCIESMLSFCDEVCVVDGGSVDGTYDFLLGLAKNESKLKIKQIVRNWSDPNFAIYDGLQKAEARAMCTKEFCWQMDCDEIVHEDDANKIVELARAMPKDALIVALPVVEYWGGYDKVRVDVMPWKWRLSKNDPRITHGVPGSFRINDSTLIGYHANSGTDGCDMIFNDTLEPVPFINFVTNEIDNIRRAALMGHEQALQQYQQWFNAAVSSLPGVFHYSWFDLPRKIRLYRDYWTSHWLSISGQSTSDTAENNMMFDLPWSEVTEQMIDELAAELKLKLGGWIWHRKWDRKITTPHIKCFKLPPKIMQ